MKLHTYQEFLDDIDEKFGESCKKEGIPFPDLLRHVKVDDPIRQRYRFNLLLTTFIGMERDERGINTAKELDDMMPEIIDKYLNECMIFPISQEPDEDVNVYVSDFIDQEFTCVGKVPMDKFIPQEIEKTIVAANREHVRFIICMSDLYIPFLQQHGTND